MATLHQDRFWPRASTLLGHTAADSLATLAVIGVPLHKRSISPGRCDLAPAAVRQALERYSPFDVRDNRDLMRMTVRDFGDLPVADMTPEEALDPVSDGVREALRECEAVVLLGGDNSITRPGLQALEGRCGLVTLDAHFDLRHLEDGLNNGNPVRALLDDGLPGANIVQIGIQPFANSAEYARVAAEAGITVVTADAAREVGLDNSLAQCLASLAERVDVIYVDLDIDVLDRAFAPAAPGARPGGFTPAEVRRAARRCGQHGKVRAMDIVELDPEHDLADMTALAAAACLLEFASGVLGRPR